MIDKSKVIGFRDQAGKLRQWFADDCQSWRCSAETLYRQKCQYVVLGEFDRTLGILAQSIEPIQAAEILMGNGIELPPDLLELLHSQDHEGGADSR